MRRALTALALLTLAGCASSTPKAPNPYQDKIDAYPIQTVNGKRMRIIPASDYLLFKEVPTPPPPSQSGTSICIDLQNQRAWLYQEGEPVNMTAVCTGKDGHRTPTGSYHVISKHKDWVSTIYHVPMPFFLRLNILGGKAGLHAGPIALSPASHGCIRLPREKAQEFFDSTPIGSKVTIF